MYNRLFWSKYIFRVFHISTVTILSGNIIWKYLFTSQNEDPSKLIQWILSFIMITSGFINTILLDPNNKMKQQSKQWIGMMHTKLVLSIIVMTPIFNQIVDDHLALEIRFVFIVFWILISPFLRFYREAWSEHHRGQPTQLQMVQFEQIPE
ncbi:unnamed protein product [Paramecium octaurelia]|uniref:Uncharacterized protein n=1 Tax=Paramecium octaurelia TaxID=43137 RepID=A0A8S1TZ48_PAROT|nr:unnamed protein product [Paramecium octaurelia]